MTNVKYVIETKNLTKSYGANDVLKGIDLNLSVRSNFAQIDGLR